MKRAFTTIFRLQEEAAGGDSRSGLGTSGRPQQPSKQKSHFTIGRGRSGSGRSTPVSDDEATKSGSNLGSPATDLPTSSSLSDVSRLAIAGPVQDAPLVMGSGLDVIKLQHINESTAFPAHLRTTLKLRGIMPSAVESLSLQVERCMARLRSIKEPLEQFAYLDRIRAEDTTLFFAILNTNLSEVVGLIYTPTVGKVCQMYSRIYTPGSVQGLFISLHDKDHLDEVLENWTYPSPDIAVMTDGSRILGLGDLGVNGMGIPVGKLSLYSAAAGINPSRTLPITLDLGTDTEEHLMDPFYLGIRAKRPSDDVFFAFTDAVMAALRRRWPDLLIQFEDFSSEHAFQLLERYRDSYFCFNDDIQGTGAVILAGFINAIKLSGVPLQEHRILFVGAGSAGVGVACQLRDYFVKTGGMTVGDATKMFWLIDSKGLITSDRKDAGRYPHHKTIFVRSDMNGEQIASLEESVNKIKPTALIGLSAVGGTFTPSIISAMAAINKRPIIFPLSNPLTSAECTFEDAMTHTNGTVLFASGTAFPPFPHPQTGELVEPGQGNNMYIFPALGLGSVLSKASRVTDDMIYASAVSLADTLNEEERKAGLLYPRLDRIRGISAVVSRDVILAAVRGGVAQSKYVLNLYGTRPGDSAPAASDVDDAWKASELLDWTRGMMYEPRYPSHKFL
ncbi:hypothetical protein HK405_010730 [Cladochytrium tenue]|nr:hypothetical protein HK405_010730 [Cladochytrium tenue]